MNEQTKRLTEIRESFAKGKANHIETKREMPFYMKDVEFLLTLISELQAELKAEYERYEANI